MIGLRILHLATSPAAAAAGDVLTTMNWLTANGHAVALAAGGTGEIPGVEMIRFNSSAASWWLGGKRSLLAQVQAWKPDLVHLHGSEAMAAARALGLDLELPVVVSIDQVLSAARSKVLRDRVISWVLVPTEAHRAHYIGRMKLERDSVSVLPFAVDIEHQVAVVPDEIGKAVTIGVSVTTEDAGLPTLVGIVAELRARGSDARLVIASGPGVDREELVSAIAEHHTDGWCEVLTAPGHDALIRRCEVLVQLAGDHRGVAPVIAAMAAGRTVVAASNAGIDELLKHDSTALVLPSDQPSVLAEVLARVVTDGALRHRLGEAAHQHARARFAIGVVGPALVELYQLAISALQNPGSKGDGSRAYKRRITTRCE